MANKKLKEKVKKDKKYFQDEIKKFHSDVEIPDNLVQDQEQKQKALDYFNNLSDFQKESFKRELERKKAREDYGTYIKYINPEFKMTRFHAVLCRLCQDVVKRVESGEKVKLIISVPPRHGKSETVTKTLPSWFVGRNPDKYAVLTAYNADLAETFGDANRKKTREFGKEIFDIEISDSQDNKAKYEIKGHSGGVMAVGITGGITGNGGSLIIIDDPYKNGQEAQNPNIRESIEQTFKDSVLTRLQGKGNAIILIQTRWHEDDLAGKLAKQDGWIVVNIPCICDKTPDKILHRRMGETLCPELGYDNEWAMNIQKDLGKKVWESLYQGHPYIDGGEIIMRSWIKYYTKSSLPVNFEEMTISCDLSFGGKKQSNDPCAIQVWGRVGANHYLVKRIKKRLSFNEMCDIIKNVSATFPQARKKIVEKKANGQAVIDSLNDTIGGFVAYDPKMDSKITRANAVAPYIESGNVYLPDEKIDPTIDEMVEEMIKFPNGEHDDEVDAMTQYLLTFRYNGEGRVLTSSGYKTLGEAFRGIKV